MSATQDIRNRAPSIFKAISSSPKQLFQLLNCIRFAPRAQVQISSEGIRFSVEESRVMQGVVFLDKALFTSFVYDGTTAAEENDENDTAANPPIFQISLAALLETLQIFGFSETTNRFQRPEQDNYSSNIRPGRPNAFSAQALGLPTTCILTYAASGAPLSIVMEEASVITTCNLNTYEPDSITPEFDEIPFNREDISVKIIMRSRYLHDAIMELSSMAGSTSGSFGSNNVSATSATRLSILASPRAPYLALSANGALGSASVEFSDSRDLLETFNVAVNGRWTQSYKFDMVRAAAEAMKLASKVSFRGDGQGVLSLQFMIELEGGGVSFVDFRFVPFVVGEDEQDTGSEEDDGDEEVDVDDEL